MIYPPAFAVEVPEIFQIEISNACNFDCVMCPRTLHKRKNKKKFLDIDLLKKMIIEDSFKGSYFVELHQAGEPLLHPDLGKIINLIKQTGVRVGLSTNGSLIHKKIEDLKNLDYITVSVDSLSHYTDIRVNGNQKKLISNILLLRKSIKAKIDLQIVELPGWEEEFKSVQSIFPEKDGFNVRSVANSFLTVKQSDDAEVVSIQPCLNPWMSVSIHNNGDVVPCCFSFWDDIVFGNLYENTLREIWKGDGAKKLREQHTTKDYSLICKRCYMRSPVLLHWNLFTNTLKGQI